MRKIRKNIATRQVIHIVGEGLTELFYFSHLKKLLGYRYSISPRLFENNSIEKIEKKIKELRDAGYIRREGSNKSGCWVIIE